MKLFVVAALLLTNTCHANSIQKSKANAVVSKDTVVKIGGYKIRILRPADSIQAAGTLLLLPGWNYSNTKWCDSTDVCKTALQKGFAVVAPDMGKSIYATQYFPETRADYKAYPTLTWLDSALNILQAKHQLFSKKGFMRNFVLGLSTGARGAALICARKPGFFHAAALLSGDYNQANITDDALCTNVYGPYHSFAERWKTIDNPVALVPKIVTPMYIGHGGFDKVVHVTQSIEFYDSLVSKQKFVLVQQNSKYVVQKQNRLQGIKGGGFAQIRYEDYLVLNIEGVAGHDFAYWRSELPAIWRFFELR